MDNLKAKVDNLDIGQLKTIPVDLKKFSDVVDNEVVINTIVKTLKTSKYFRKENFWCNCFNSHKSIQYR